MDKRIFSCNEHIEVLMDDLLEEAHQMPIIETIQSEEKCTVCRNKAVYQLIGSDVKAIWE